MRRNGDAQEEGLGWRHGFWLWSCDPVLPVFSSYCTVSHTFVERTTLQPEAASFHKLLCGRAAYPQCKGLAARTDSIPGSQQTKHSEQSPAYQILQKAVQDVCWSGQEVREFFRSQKWQIHVHQRDKNHIDAAPMWLGTGKEMHRPMCEGLNE